MSPVSQSRIGTSSDASVPTKTTPRAVRAAAPRVNHFPPMQNDSMKDPNKAEKKMPKEANKELEQEQNDYTKSDALPAKVQVLFC